MILMYHKVSPESPTMWWVTADDFRRQMLELAGREIVYLDEYDPSETDQVVITFDGVYSNVLMFAAPILQELGYPFELFVTGDYIGRDNEFDVSEPTAMFADEAALRQLISMGGRLQWHGNAHISLGEIKNREDIERELAIPPQIRKLDPAGFRWFGYPHGTLNETVVDCVSQQSFSGAVSCHQGNEHDIYRLNRVTVTNDTSFRKAGVAVIIPCYNYGSYLIEAVESVLRQTLPPQEILISNDASTDDTARVMDILAARYGEKLSMHHNPVNLGIVAHFNQAVGMTSADYVCFLGADNRFRSDFLERTVTALDRHPDAAVAYTDFALFGTRAPLIASNFAKHYPVEKKGDHFHIVQFPDFSAEARQLFLSKQNFIHGSSLFRRKAFDRAGGYRVADQPEDWSLFRDMVKSGWSAVRCPWPLLEYRQHSAEQANNRLISQTELQYYKEAYHQLEAEVRRIKSTWSWRITSPLRAGWNLPRNAMRKIRNFLNSKGFR